MKKNLYIVPMVSFELMESDELLIYSYWTPGTDAIDAKQGSLDLGDDLKDNDESEPDFKMDFLIAE